MARIWNHYPVQDTDLGTCYQDTLGKTPSAYAGPSPRSTSGQTFPDETAVRGVLVGTAGPAVRSLPRWISMAGVGLAGRVAVRFPEGEVIGSWCGDRTLRMGGMLRVRAWTARRSIPTTKPDTGRWVRTAGSAVRVSTCCNSMVGECVVEWLDSICSEEWNIPR